MEIIFSRPLRDLIGLSNLPSTACWANFSRPGKCRDSPFYLHSLYFSSGAGVRMETGGLSRSTGRMNLSGERTICRNK